MRTYLLSLLICCGPWILLSSAAEPAAEVAADPASGPSYALVGSKSDPETIKTTMDGATAKLVLYDGDKKAGEMELHFRGDSLACSAFTMVGEKEAVYTASFSQGFFWVASVDIRADDDRSLQLSTTMKYREDGTPSCVGSLSVVKSGQVKTFRFDGDITLGEAGAAANAKLAAARKAEKAAKRKEKKGKKKKKAKGNTEE